MKQLYYRICIFLGFFRREEFVTAFEVVEYAIMNYPKNPKLWIGICVSLKLALKYKAGINIPSRNVPDILTKLNRRFLNAKYFYVAYWWDCFGENAYKYRVNALYKLLNYYKNHNVLIRKNKHLS